MKVNSSSPPCRPSLSPRSSMWRCLELRSLTTSKRNTTTEGHHRKLPVQCLEGTQPRADSRFTAHRPPLSSPLSLLLFQVSRPTRQLTSLTSYCEEERRKWAPCTERGKWRSLTSLRNCGRKKWELFGLWRCRRSENKDQRCWLRKWKSGWKESTRRSTSSSCTSTTRREGLLSRECGRRANQLSVEKRAFVRFTTTRMPISGNDTRCLSLTQCSTPRERSPSRLNEGIN